MKNANALRSAMLKRMRRKRRIAEQKPRLIRRGLLFKTLDLSADFLEVEVQSPVNFPGLRWWSCCGEFHMRYSQNHKAQTHQRIIKEASARFRKDGIGATGLQPLMKALGLTHGGFYSHFKSKDELVEKALQEAGDQVDGLCAEIFAQEN